ncbi:putative membrane protein [Aquimarina intermedia]|uniref:Putative membrane protein n=1 Tax=Aquimarina intermedia TaxID=350814 RepID=A0A5S5C3F9_9FLAO|nr:putative membrane protein [Aquimarina intermedia]
MSWHLYLLSFILIIAGIFHLIKPKAFMRIMPLYLPYRKTLVYLSGLLEITLGILLITMEFKIYVLWCIILLLILFFPVHVHMIINKKAGLNLPKSVLIFRFFLQFILIYWVYQYL